MIFIVDSGATKADWVAVDALGNKLFFTQTPGLNPEVVTKELVKERLINNNDLDRSKLNVKKVFFYGAGCGTKRMQVFMGEVLKEYFPKATIEVCEDTYAAIFATTGREKMPAVVSIIGTGSNCSLWDGVRVVQKTNDTVFNLKGNAFCVKIKYKPSEIRTWEDLQGIRKVLDGNYKIINDITFPKKYEFSPIGNDKNPFEGHLDGQGFTIRKLNINRPRSKFVGFFGKTSKTVVIESLKIEGNITGKDIVGGIVGHNKGKTQAQFKGKITAEKHTGGIAGINDGMLVGTSEGELEGSLYVGGLSGINGGDILGHSSIKISSKSDYVGGLVGLNLRKGKIRGYYKGIIEGKKYIGGLCGQNKGNIIGFCTGKLTASWGYIGGMVGENSETIKGYSKNEIDAVNIVGGMVGNNTSSGKIIGYNRTQMTRTSGAFEQFGMVAAIDPNNEASKVYFSASETSIKDKISPSTTILHTNNNGNSKGVGSVTNATELRSLFINLTFGSNEGEWSFSARGEWPKLNFGDLTNWDSKTMGAFLPKSGQPTK
ncbi:BadF-type ATPase [Elysia marginata]|uniref:BadF-type ATPase n=1 Tax=Elysia marginata TaxID=1093978 RepID=A0AAV4G6B3_9GAST|nr:BadF-type ATPase [Elysia marginata]